MMVSANVVTSGHCVAGPIRLLLIAVKVSVLHSIYIIYCAETCQISKLKTAMLTKHCSLEPAGQ